MEEGKTRELKGFQLQSFLRICSIRQIRSSFHLRHLHELDPVIHVPFLSPGDACKFRVDENAHHTDAYQTCRNLLEPAGTC